MTSTPAPMAEPRGTPDDTRPARLRPHFVGFGGVRAIAVSLVVVHHAVSFAGETRSGPLAEIGAVGDIGVGLFFVLSGFLIYRPFAVAGLDGTPPPGTVSFWRRRLLRIVPAYWLALTVFWVAGNYELGSLGDIVRYYGFFQVYDRSTAFGGIRIAWSLNTEMAFYLMVPVWGWLVRRLGRGRPTLAVELGCALALLASGYISRAVFSSASPDTRSVSFIWLPNNVDLFAGGMLLAILHAWVTGAGRGSAWARRINRFLAGRPEVWAAGFVVLYGWYALRVGPAPFNIGYRGAFWQQRQLVILVLATCLIAPLAFGERRDLLRRFMTWGPVHWVGTVSYGFYLWHTPLMTRVANPLAPGEVSWTGWAGTAMGDTNILALLGAGFGLGLVAASVSWYLLERPLLRLKRPV